jgi:hypothetical protein
MVHPIVENPLKAEEYGRFFSKILIGRVVRKCLSIL